MVRNFDGMNTNVSQGQWKLNHSNGKIEHKQCDQDILWIFPFSYLNSLVFVFLKTEKNNQSKDSRGFAVTRLCLLVFLYKYLIKFYLKKNDRLKHLLLPSSNKESFPHFHSGFWQLWKLSSKVFNTKHE